MFSGGADASSFLRCSISAGGCNRPLIFISQAAGMTSIGSWLASLMIAGVMMTWCPACQVASASESALCRAAVSQIEASLHIPDAFLSAIARVESGRPDAETGSLAPWPWTIDAEGHGAFFATKAEAVAAVQALQARGVRSIDVGCLQVNLEQHPDAFASVEQAFDPSANAAYAGHFLLGLFGQTRSWPRAAAAYHSQTPHLGAAYQERVLAEWSVPDSGDGRQPSPARPDRGQTRALPARVAASGAPAGVPDNAAMLRPGPAAGGPALGRVAAFTSRAVPAAAGVAATGRGLDAYRTLPTALAVRWAPRPG